MARTCYKGRAENENDQRAKQYEITFNPTMEGVTVQKYKLFYSNFIVQKERPGGGQQEPQNRQHLSKLI